MMHPLEPRVEYLAEVTSVLGFLWISLNKGCSVRVTDHHLRKCNPEDRLFVSKMPNRWFILTSVKACAVMLKLKFNYILFKMFVRVQRKSTQKEAFFFTEDVGNGVLTDEWPSVTWTFLVDWSYCPSIIMKFYGKRGEKLVWQPLQTSSAAH